MNILITGNYNNLKRMVVMLYSLFMQEPGEVNVYIPAVNTDDETLRYLSMYVESWQGKRLIPVYTDMNIWNTSEYNSCLWIEKNIDYAKNWIRIYRGYYVLIQI